MGCTHRRRRCSGAFRCWLLLLVVGVACSSQQPTSTELGVDQTAAPDLLSWDTPPSPDIKPAPPDLGRDVDLVWDASPPADLPQDRWPDPPDAPMGDLGPAGRCTTAPLLGFAPSTATVSDDINRYRDEFPGLRCRTGASGTTLLAGPQAYYRIQGLKGRWYRFLLEPASTMFSAYLYVFTSTPCSEASIAQDCQSEGVRGASLREAARGGRPRVVYFQAAADGPIWVAVDATARPVDGRFTLSIREVKAPKNSVCSAAEPLPTKNGEGKVTGQTATLMTPNEFVGGLDCGGGKVFAGPQVYYSFQATAPSSYQFKLTNHAGSALRSYVFSAGCSAASAGADCSGGVVGTAAQIVVDASDTGMYFFTPLYSGTYHVAVDGFEAHHYGLFTLEMRPYLARGRCNNLRVIQLNKGKASMSGNTLWGGNLTVDCQGAIDFRGDDEYLKLWVRPNKTYKLTYSPNFDSYWYAFRDSSCGNVTVINQDCGSGGLTGELFGHATSGKATTKLFRPTTSGIYVIALDSNQKAQGGSYTLDVEEL